MARPTKLNRRVVRETAVIDYRRRKPLMIELMEGGHRMRLWIKGDRKVKYLIPIQLVFQEAVRLKVREDKEAKAKAQQERKRRSGHL